MNVRDFAGVRAEVAARTRLPDPAVLRERGRRRRRTHRSMSITASVLALALVVGGGFGLSQLRSHAGEPMALISTPRPASPYGVVCDTVAYDAKDVYYVINTLWDCYRTTGFILSHSPDAGRTWQTWWMPEVGKGEELPPFLLDRSTLVWRQVISRDGGRTWRSVPQTGPTVAEIPAGWPLAWVDMERSGRQYVAVDPATGQRYPLTSQPNAGLSSLAQGQHLVLPAADGSLWVAVSDDNNHYAVAVSRDHGRSWRRSPALSRSGAFTVASRDGKTAYACGDDMTNKGPDRMFRTTDGGVSWHLVDQPAPTRLCASGELQLVVRADGSLLAVAPWTDGELGGPLMASTDGGRTFRAVPGLPTNLTQIERLPGGGYQLSGVTGNNDDGVRTLVSADGVTFQPVHIPPGASQPG
ncbi:WD40/YVTN/BNR-like repeat-containing protein [Fodinicola acaciae]|uniref:WD40/YVTN/BNR-like repeat-containing protein n=1 Tax=Fodinicola acaciae TaxID=2681555 RepID=UPI0013D7E370|nr:sialidase family protein [Fodinicola acaciae]